MNNDDIGNTKLDIFIPRNILKIIACFIFVSVSIWSMIEGFAKSETVNAVLELRSAIVEEDFKIIKLVLIKENNSIILSGKLINTSQYTYILAGMDIEYLNSKHEVIGTSTPVVRKIKPGNEWNIYEVLNDLNIQDLKVKKYYGTRDMSS